MTEFGELERAVASLSKSIADFPVGAISLDDLKPTEEKIQDLRHSLKDLNARILMLRAKDGAREFFLFNIDFAVLRADELRLCTSFSEKSSGVPEESEQESYDALQDATAHWTINNKVVGACLQSSETVEILESSQDTEISR